MPHREPFLFLESASISGDKATARYKISGNEYFLEGHFKENPVFPASIMIEALGQLCVFYLLKGENESLAEKVNPNTIFFTSCDGVKCRRICKPGDVLEMQVKVNRVRHPLASFQGEINVEGQKTSTAEEIKLAFDYYPVIEGQTSTISRRNTSQNRNGSHSNGSEELASKDLPKRFVKFSSDS
jgi:3-hydroxyacyl-[acyl-carrier-protein] dehydratase